MQAQQNRQRKIVSLCGSEAGKSLGIFAFSAAVNLILLVLLSSGRPFVYSMADDMLLRNMLSGSLYDAGYNILFKSWLSQLISWLYRNTSLTIWYALLVIGGNAAASTVILYAAMKLATGWKRKGISALFFLFFYIGYCYRFLYPTYTETACLLLLAATLVFIVGITKDGKSWLRWIDFAAALVLSLLSYSLREEAFFMMIPFAGVAWLCFVVGEGDKEKRRDGIIFVLALAVGIGVIFAHDYAMYEREGYSWVKEYYQARVDIVDYYGLPDYEENREFYEEAEISESSYEYLKNRSFLLDPEKDMEAYLEVAEYAKETAKAPDFRTLCSRFIKNFFFNAGTASEGGPAIGLMAPFSLIALCVALALAAGKGDKNGLFLAASAFCVYLLIGFYLSYRNRFPSRVVIPLFVALYWISFVIVIRNLTVEIKWKRYIVGMAAFLLMAVITGQYCVQDLDDRKWIYDIFSSRERDVWEYFAEHPDRLYLSSTFLWGSGGYASVSEAEMTDNYILINDYAAQVPQYAEKMEENGIDPERVIDSIVGREDVYLILYFEDIAENIQDYLDTEYPGCELKVVDHILDSNVYQITENR